MNSTHSYSISERQTDSPLIDLTSCKNRANMSPTRGVNRSKSKQIASKNLAPASSVSIFFAEKADNSLVNKVLGMLLETQYEDKG